MPTRFHLALLLARDVAATALEFSFPFALPSGLLTGLVTHLAFALGGATLAHLRILPTPLYVLAALALELVAPVTSLRLAGVLAEHHLASLALLLALAALLFLPPLLLIALFTPLLGLLGLLLSSLLLGLLSLPSPLLVLSTLSLLAPSPAPLVSLLGLMPPFLAGMLSPHSLLSLGVLLLALHPTLPAALALVTELLALLCLLSLMPGMQAASASEMAATSLVLLALLLPSSVLVEVTHDKRWSSCGHRRRGGRRREPTFRWTVCSNNPRIVSRTSGRQSRP